MEHTLGGEGEVQKSILIVEDDAELLGELADKFTGEKFTVFSAENGTLGLSSALSDHPDVILLDIVMLQMDGLTMLQKLRAADEWGKQVPVVFLTDLSPDNDKVIARISENEPAYHVIKNDFLLADVVLKVNEALHTSDHFFTAL